MSGRELLAPAPPTPMQTVIAHQPPASVAQVCARIVWGVALVVMAGAGVDGFMSIQMQTGAPQQAAAAAIACFHMIVPYVLARAFHQMIGGQ